MGGCLVSIVDEPVVPVLVAPAVAGKADSNPGIRLYIYNRTSGQIKDFLQYYLNYIDASDSNVDPIWLLGYFPSKSYDLRDLSASSLQDLVYNFTYPLKEEFQGYVGHYRNVKSRPDCGMLCWRHHICSICNVDYSKFDHCLDTIIAQPNQNEISHKIDMTEEILGFDSDYDNVLHNDDNTDNNELPPILKDNGINTYELPFDWSTVSDNNMDIYGNTVDVDPPPCAKWNPRCRHQNSVRTRHTTPSYMYIIVYAIVGLLVFSVVLVTVLCCFWPRHKMFSNEPKYVAVETSDAMEAFDNTGDNVGYY